MFDENNIEIREILGEVGKTEYQPIRFTRIKYKNNPIVFIDIRRFNREVKEIEGSEDDYETIYHPTKYGFQFPESQFKNVINNWTILPSTLVHPDIIDKSFDLLAKGQFESAVLQAYKQIEIRIREKSNLPNDEYGVNLIRKAYNPESGILTDSKLPIAERQAFSNYIAGAYALFKNPVSHRNVQMDFFDAFEKIIVASQIIKLIEKSPFK